METWCVRSDLRTLLPGISQGLQIVEHAVFVAWDNYREIIEIREE
jgi:hypothetical protein